MAYGVWGLIGVGLGFGAYRAERMGQDGDWCLVVYGLR